MDNQHKPFINDWQDNYNDRGCSMQYPTGHVARLTQTEEEYWGRKPDGSIHRATHRGFTASVTSPLGEVVWQQQLGNNRPKAQAFAADRAYRHIYGLVEYALLSKAAQNQEQNRTDDTRLTA